MEAYPAMSTVRPAALLGRLVDLDVLDNEIARVKALGVRVGFGVAQQRQQELRRLHRPARA